MWQPYQPSPSDALDRAHSYISRPYAAPSIPDPLSRPPQPIGDQRLA